ncbi:Uncharacterised protein [Legionella hackeliae]|uniref:Uncharacterized protein n=1 Tax=Legionella hackeliae TaxID=449 RepID=A0A0A8UTI8_LEGHA|nr:protein of unknown function [Legionella hackeliae]STX48932.1 Uncharacterised protein [Legionella hackeliae]
MCGRFAIDTDYKKSKNSLAFTKWNFFPNNFNVGGQSLERKATLNKNT